MLEHGGQLRAAAARYGIPLRDWLDLSTGINPIPFAPPPVPQEAWSRLPEEHDGLEEAAASYYGTINILPVAGTQAAIQALPRLRSPCRVGVPHPGYAEHAHAWRNAGHEVKELRADEIAAQVGNLDVLVLMQPNNPTGGLFALDDLLRWHAELSARGGWLVADEAFIEASVAQSMVQAAMPHGLIVLRSMGKFFGLAGARTGFVAAHAALLASLREALGPWCVAGPARHVVRAALLDRAWQQAAKKRLMQNGQRLAQLLRDADLQPTGGCGLFQWVQAERAEIVHRHLAQCGILTRYFAEPRSLRFGLPGSEADWLRLAATLDGLRDCRSGSARHARPSPLDNGQ